MKNSLTLLGLMPFMAFAQTETGTGSLIALIMTLVFAFIIFLVIRGLMLWYWKVDKIVNNLEDQKRLLQAILQRMDQENKSNNNPSI